MLGEGSEVRRRRLWQSGAAVKGYRVARRTAERLGLQVVLKTYYSPIPDLTLLPDDWWERRDPMNGIDFDVDRQLAFVEEHLAGHLRRFGPPADVPAEYAFEEDNPSYPVPDARVLYAMVRHLRPRRIVELGSGQTTRVIAQAARENGAEGSPALLRAYDPFPTAIDDGLPGLDALVRQKAQDVGDDVFGELEAGDLLFVDTTHTVKAGSDVNHIVLRVLPLLAAGVVVHFHDVCLPYEYPRYLFDDYGLYWAEQYLLQAFLACNASFEVLFGVHALGRDRAEGMAAAGALRAGQGGSALWIRRV